MNVVRAGVLLACLVFLAGCGSGSGSADEERAAIGKYRSYLLENAGSLLDWTTQMKGEIGAEELGGARFSYAMSRVQYGQIEPVAQLFKRLDTDINVHPNEVDGGEFGGFHRIEKALFPEESTAGVAGVTKDLVVDEEALRQRLKTVDLQPVQIAGSASRMANEISTYKLTGAEEPYSHIDLVDISANVEGAEAAFKGVKPVLVNAGEDRLVKESEARFDDVFEALRPLGSPARITEQAEPESAGIMFDIYDELPEGFEHHIDRPVKALAAVLAQIPPRVSQSVDSP